MSKEDTIIYALKTLDRLDSLKDEYIEKGESVDLIDKLEEISYSYHQMASSPDEYPMPTQEESSPNDGLTELLDEVKGLVTDKAKESEEDKPDEEEPSEYPYPSEKGKIIKHNREFYKSFDY
jgi:hypothetical protein